MAFDIITPTKIGQGEIGLTNTTFRTTPTASIDLIKSIDIANSNAATAAVSVFLVPSGGVTGAGNVLFSVSIATSENMPPWRGTLVMNEGDTLQAISGVSGVSLNAGGGNAV